MSEDTNKVTEQQEQVQQVKADDIDQFDLDVEQVKKWFSTEAGKKTLQPLLDKHFSKGLETWKSNNLQTVIEKEIEARFPTDPVQKELLELKKELERKDNEAKVIRQLEQFGIPSELSGVFSQASEEELKVFTERFNKAVIGEVNKRLGANGGTPKTNHNSNHSMLTKEQILGLSYGERAMLFMSDPTSYKRAMKGV